MYPQDEVRIHSMHHWEVAASETKPPAVLQLSPVLFLVLVLAAHAAHVWPDEGVTCRVDDSGSMAFARTVPDDLASDMAAQRCT
jgi:hypothetical protein